VARWVNRVLRRKSDDWPVGPPELVASLASVDVPALPAEGSA